MTARVASARNDPSGTEAAVFRGLREAVRVPSGSQALLVEQFLLDAEVWALTGPADESRGVAGSAYARRFLEMLLRYDLDRAGALIDEVVAAGFTVAQVHREILEAVLVESGLRWERAQMSVAQEHYVSEAVRGVMDGLLRSAKRSPRCERTFIAMCAEGEHHCLGLPMVHDQLALQGWKTIWLGADVPNEEVSTVVRANAPAVIGLSVTMTTNLSRARAAIANLRALNSRLRVVVGGKPFREAAGLWERVGADASALDAATGLKAAARLGDELEPFRPPGSK